MSIAAAYCEKEATFLFLNLCNYCNMVFHNTVPRGGGGYLIKNLNANENFSVDLNFKKAVTLQYFLRFLAIHKQLGRGEKGQGGRVRWGLIPQG